LAALGLGLGAASCGNLIGLEEWENPNATPSEGSSQGGNGGNGGSGGGGGNGGDPGMGGAGGAGTSSTTSGGGGVAEQQAEPVCKACLAVACAAEIKACEDNASCKQNYRPCMFDGGPCCKQSGGAWAGPLAQAAHECIVKKCADECFVNTHCGDCLLSLPETDVDCGGDSCSPCETGKECAWDGDCESATCSVSGTCL
jgi:hypothetical protein